MSKYKVGDKFIIEIKEVMDSDNGTLYRSNFSTLVFDDYGLDKLEQLEEIKAHQPDPQQIEIGDVVYADGVQAVVIDITFGETYYIYNENGCIEEHLFKDLKKTGRHIDIDHLLEQIRGDD